MTFLFSSFIFMLLEYYDLQLQHLSPHSITLVVIFIHLYDMYMCMLPSVRLFCHFHMLRSFRRSPTPHDGYYFQHRIKGPSVYIAALTPSK
jgi:hypothetical protein